MRTEEEIREEAGKMLWELRRKSLVELRDFLLTMGLNLSGIEVSKRNRHNLLRLADQCVYDWRDMSLHGQRKELAVLNLPQEIAELMGFEEWAANTATRSELCDTYRVLVEHSSATDVLEQSPMELLTMAVIGAKWAILSTKIAMEGKYGTRS